MSLSKSFNIDILNFEPSGSVSGSCLDNVMTSLEGQTDLIEYHPALKFISTLDCGDKIKSKFVKKSIINDK